jgi:anti-anti-sigma regulatory factor
MSAVPYIDIAGSKMLLDLTTTLNKKGIDTRIVQALSNVRDLLRKQGMEKITGHINRSSTIAETIVEFQGGIHG